MISIQATRNRQVHQIQFDEQRAFNRRQTQNNEDPQAIQTIDSLWIDVPGHLDQGPEVTLIVYLWRHVGESAWIRALIFPPNGYAHDPYDVADSSSDDAAQFWLWANGLQP
ncbi:MAG: hypothetical protein AB7F43_14540 [Bacteriovoracia bacterium]